MWHVERHGYVLAIIACMGHFDHLRMQCSHDTSSHVLHARATGMEHMTLVKAYHVGPDALVLGGPRVPPRALSPSNPVVLTHAAPGTMAYGRSVWPAD